MSFPLLLIRESESGKMNDKKTFFGTGKAIAIRKALTPDMFSLQAITAAVLEKYSLGGRKVSVDFIKWYLPKKVKPDVVLIKAKGHRTPFFHLPDALRDLEALSEEDYLLEKNDFKEFADEKKQKGMEIAVVTYVRLDYDLEKSKKKKPKYDIIRDWGIMNGDWIYTIDGKKHKINAKKNRSIKPVNKVQDLKLSYDELQKFIKLKERVQKIADKNKT